jgi:hypothetical protein
MWKSWYEKTRLIEREEAEIRAEVIGSSSVAADVPTIQPARDAEIPVGVELRAANKNVVRVCDSQGKPTLAILPWDAYRELLTRGRSPKRGRRKGHVARDDGREPTGASMPGVAGGRGGRRPVEGSHILKELVRDHPDSSAAEIARIFEKKAGVLVNRSTIFRYRKRAEARRDVVVPEPAREVGTLVVNGIELGEYDTIIADAAIRAGARPDTARESDEYADGLVGLYEAAEDFDPGGKVQFARFAAERIRRAIARGREDRKVKVKGKSGRVLNFSEIGDEDFDIADMIDDSGKLSS